MRACPTISDQATFEKTREAENFLIPVHPVRLQPLNGHVKAVSSRNVADFTEPLRRVISRTLSADSTLSPISDWGEPQAALPSSVTVLTTGGGTPLVVAEVRSSGVLSLPFGAVAGRRRSHSTTMPLARGSPLRASFRHRMASP